MASPPRIRSPRIGREPKQRRVYLGPAYAFPDSMLRSQERARLLFLEILSRLYPDVVNDLGGAPLEVHRRATETGGFGPEDAYEIAADEDYDLSPAGDALRSELRAWATRWNLCRPWAREYALLRLDLLASGFDDGWLPPNMQGRTLGRGELKFEGWDPGYERWSEWERRFRRDLRASLKAHRIDQEKRARDAGMEPNTESKLAIHFAWLAAFQVGREPLSRIAAEVGQERSTIRDGVRSVARLIDLDLRESRRGRPTK